MTDKKREEAKRHVARLRSFYQQLTSYVVINLVLIAVNLLTNPKQLWFYWVTLFWGISIVLQALKLFGPGGKLNTDWEERKIQEYLKKRQ